MTMEHHLLSFELDKDHETLFIHGDEAGLRLLIQTLEKLIAQTKDGHFDHDHLMTPQWGGWELSAENKGDTALNHVKVYCWKGDKCQA
jgi:hypothetical protein